MLTEFAEDAWRVVLEVEVSMRVSRRLRAPSREEIALPLLVEVCLPELRERCGAELAHRRADAHEHHEDELETVVPLRDQLARRNLCLARGRRHPRRRARLSRSFQ